jgi:hypothetical protein
MVLGFANELNEVKFGPFIIINESCVFIIITVHFCLVIVSDVVLALQNSLSVRLILIKSVNKTYKSIFNDSLLCKSLTFSDTLDAYANNFCGLGYFYLRFVFIQLFSIT